MTSRSVTKKSFDAEVITLEKSLASLCAPNDDFGRIYHSPSNGRLQKVTTSPFTFLLKGHSSVLEGL